jgi:hypothetical protein
MVNAQPGRSISKNRLGYTVGMGFRVGMVTGFAAGYYLGARAGRQRYDQINRQLARLRRSDAFEHAADRARTVVDEGVGKARSIVEARAGDGYAGDQGNGLQAGAGEPPAGLGGYSSSR